MMSEQWSVKPLIEVAEIISGQSPKGEFYNDEGNGLPFYQGKKRFEKKYLGSPIKWTSKTTKIAYEGDILMSVRAPVGPINFATQEICIGRGLAAIRVSEHIDRDFLFYQLLFKQNEISGKDGAVFPSINRKMIGDIKVVVPSMEDQQRIVSILDEAFENIEENKNHIVQKKNGVVELLQELLRSLMLSEQSGNKFREIRIHDVIEPLTTINPSKQPNVEIEYIDVSSVNRDTLCVEKTSILLGSKAPSRARRLVRTGDVIFATIRPTLQRIAIIPETLDEAICSTGYFVLRPKNEVLSRYLFYYLLTPRFNKEMESSQRGASYPAVSDNDVKEHIILIPSLEEQQRIVSILDEVFENINGIENSFLKALKLNEELAQSILQEAFNGNLTKEIAA